MKKKRLNTMLSLIEEYSISTQEQMLIKLRECGYDVTQATVSRDIRELRLVKEMDENGEYRYVHGKNEPEKYLSKFNAIFSHSVITSDFAGYTVVIKCYTGMAQAACASFDNMEWEGLVGTVAGDDTIFALCRTPELAQELNDSIENLLK